MTGIADFYKIEIAFGIAPLDATSLANDANWVDVTSQCRSVRATTSTRSSEFNTFVAGQAKIVLDNRARDFDARYASSPYNGDLVRFTPVRCSGWDGSAWQGRWFGFAETWTPSYRMPDATVTLRALDSLWLWAQTDRLAGPARSGESVVHRLGAVADAIGWPSSWRDFDPSSSSGVTETDFDRNALAEAVEAVRADGGHFMCDPSNGHVRFSGRNAVSTDTRLNTSTATLRPATTEPTYLLDSLVDSATGADYRNVVRITSSSGEVSTVDTRATNEAARVFSETLAVSDADAVALAAFYSDLYSTDTPAAQRVKVRVATASSLLRSGVIAASLWHRVQLEFTPPGGVGSAWSDQLFVDGYTDEVNPQEWVVTFDFSSADRFDDNLAGPPSTWLILDDPSDGILDTNTLGY